MLCWLDGCSWYVLVTGVKPVQVGVFIAGCTVMKGALLGTSGLAISPEFVGAGLAARHGAPSKAPLMPVLLHAVLEDLVEGFGTPFHLWKFVLRSNIPACKTVGWRILSQK